MPMIVEPGTDSGDLAAGKARTAGAPSASERAAPSYAASGVVYPGEPLAGLLRWVKATFAFRQGLGSSHLGLELYANVLDLGNNLGLALSTDGVGTKILIAEMMDRYDTVGIDCVAMNANDLLCVGAEPLAMLDYLAVERADPEMLESIGRGLYEGARLAGITIPGGELAQLRDMITGARPDRGFDLAGTCVGTVPLDRIVAGQDVQPGDVLLGLASSGIHSNGFSLARAVLLEQTGWSVDRPVAEFGRTLGEELLEPTRIYVREALEILRGGPGVKALMHVTGDGLLNLARITAPMGFRLHSLPEPPPVFRLIQRLGSVPEAEMYRVFNMGVGFCVALSPEAVDRARATATAAGIDSWVLGEAVADPQRRIWLEPMRLVSERGEFRAV